MVRTAGKFRIHLVVCFFCRLKQIALCFPRSCSSSRVASRCLGRSPEVLGTCRRAEASGHTRIYCTEFYRRPITLVCRPPVSTRRPAATPRSCWAAATHTTSLRPVRRRRDVRRSAPRLAGACCSLPVEIRQSASARTRLVPTARRCPRTSTPTVPTRTPATRSQTGPAPVCTRRPEVTPRSVWGRTAPRLQRSARRMSTPRT
mmetsp:Transcript_142423/g.455201  ORF Transcript_142423/g.455201 Transcript_142423/m.455201 type:complete len:203 (+) Transcript_142423:2856-3464(+)